MKMTISMSTRIATNTPMKRLISFLIIKNLKKKFIYYNWKDKEYEDDYKYEYEDREEHPLDQGDHLKIKVNIYSDYEKFRYRKKG